VTLGLILRINVREELEPTREKLTAAAKTNQRKPPSASRETKDSTEIEVQPTAVSESDRGSDLFFVSASRPNPFRSSVSISYTLPVDDRVRVEVFDVSGQIVRTLADGTVASGTHTATWDGTDSSGRPVTNGIYFFKLTASSKMEMRRVILLR
jgi:hypothetical protein